MPWIPELFSAPALEHIREVRQVERLAAVPYFDGLLAGELDALVGSFAGEPELHHPVRGRIRGVRAFTQYVADTTAWIAERHVIADRVHVIRAEQRGVEEVMLHLDSHAGERYDLPLSLAADFDEDGRLTELRLYSSSWPGSGRHATRPPLLQPDPDLDAPAIVGEYLDALAAGDVDGVVAAFEPDAYVREPSGGRYVHRGAGELRALYELYFSNGGGIPLERCAVTDDGECVALEYNVVAWGRTRLPPAAGIAVYVRGGGGRLAAARIYDDLDPPV